MALTSLAPLLLRRVASGLERSAIRHCSEWAERYRVMGGKSFPGPLTFKPYPWSKALHDDEAEFIVAQKSAQMGFTEAALNKTLYAIDMFAASVLYMLPASEPDAKDFSEARFEAALDMSPHLRDMFSDTDNIKHKRAGGASLYIRGSRSRGQAKSIPVDLLIGDEVDEMIVANLKLAFERLSGQLEKQVFLLSTPTIEGFGINEFYKATTQAHYHFKCPSCSKYTELLFPTCLIITAEASTDRNILNSHLVCKECNATLAHNTKQEWLANGTWIPQYTDRIRHGYHISQLYSCTIRPDEIAAAYLDSLTSPEDEQEFFNSKLGKPHEVKGARVTQAEIEACIGTYAKTQESTTFTTMGVDVGKKLHYIKIEWSFPNESMNVNKRAHAKVIDMGTCLDFADLPTASFMAIDAQPEGRKSKEFCEKYLGRAIAVYEENIKTRPLNHKRDDLVSVDRTYYLDLALGRFHQANITLPMDTSLEFKEHMKASVKIWKKDKDGNPAARYISKDPDHYAHALLFAEVALTVGASAMQNEDVTNLW